MVPVLAKQFENVFPELQKQVDFVSKVVKEEEEGFLRTLEKGLKKIDEIITEVSEKVNAKDISDAEIVKVNIKGSVAGTSSAIGTLSGKITFELYDTFGFPLELTQEAIKAAPHLRKG